MKSDSSAEQEAEWLDAAGNVDRLAIAIGEIDLPVHDSAAACAKRSKARAGRGLDRLRQARRHGIPERRDISARNAGPRHGRGRRSLPETRGSLHCLAVLQQIGCAKTRSFQHIQCAEHGGAVGAVRARQPAGVAAKPGEIGQHAPGARTIVPIRQHGADAGPFQRLFQRQQGRGIDLQEAAITGTVQRSSAPSLASSRA